MRKLPSIFLIFIFLFLMICTPQSLKAESSNSSFFTDVPPDHWAYQALLQLLAMGIVQGYSDGTFRGNQAITRYEMALIIYNLLMYIKANYNISGSDQGGDLNTLVNNILANSLITEEQAKLMKDLIAEFQLELADIREKLDALEKRVEKLENDKTSLYLSIVAVLLSGLALIFSFFN